MISSVSSSAPAARTSSSRHPRASSKTPRVTPSAAIISTTWFSSAARSGDSQAALTRSNGVAIAPSPHQLAELLEQVATVVRAGGRLGVVLHAEHRQTLVPHPLQ